MLTSFVFTRLLLRPHVAVLNRVHVAFGVGAATQVVKSGFEPPMFTAVFHGWVRRREEYEDPREKRLRELKQLGLMGDMEGLYGRVIDQAHAK